MSVTLEEASDCPICGVRAQQTVVRSGSRGSKLYTFECRNEDCRWFDTGFIVQVRSDGTVYERQKGEKEFAPIPTWQQAGIERQLERLRDAREV